MQDDHLREHLTRYRATHDPVWIAALFEATSPGLWQLAMHLARDPADADDLLQRTFLAVIEGVERYDPAQPAMGWMVGILSNKAREHRRRAARQVDLERLVERVPETPPEAARSQEEKTLLGEAVGSLPDLYRQVVELVLESGLAPAEIAARLDRTPGAVRVQLHRAVALLRRTLPAGMALPAVLLSIQSTGLEAVRQAVQRAAVERSAQAAGIGGGAAGAKVAMITLGLCILGLGAWTTVELGAGTDGSWMGPPLQPPAPTRTPGSPDRPGSGANDHVDTTRAADGAESPPDSDSRTSQAGPASGLQAVAQSFEFTVEGGEGLSLDRFEVVSASSADLTFDEQVTEVRAHGANRLVPFPADDPPAMGARRRRARAGHSSDCLLRSVLAFDPTTVAREQRLELGWPDAERNVFAVFGERGCAVVARVNWRWNPERERSESLFRAIYNPQAPIFGPGVGIPWVGFRLEPEAFDQDPLADEMERRREVQRRELDARVNELAGMSKDSSAKVRGLLALRHAYSIRYADPGLVNAAFSFEHDTRLDSHHVQGDWDLILDERGALDICIRPDDRSRGWLLRPGPQGTVWSSLESPKEGDTLMVHTVDADTDRWDALQLLEVRERQWIVFGWRAITEQASIDAFRARGADAGKALLGKRVRIRIQADKAGTGPRRAFLDGTSDTRPVRPGRGPDLEALGTTRDRRAERWARIDGGHVPSGKRFDVESVEWSVEQKRPPLREPAALGSSTGSTPDGKPGDDEPKPAFRIWLRDQEIVSAGETELPLSGRWRGLVTLGPLDTSEAFVEASASLECDVTLHGTWRDAPP